MRPSSSHALALSALRRIVAARPLVDGPMPFVPGALVAADASQGRAAVRKLRHMGADFVKVYTKLLAAARIRCRPGRSPLQSCLAYILHFLQILLTVSCYWHISCRDCGDKRCALGQDETTTIGVE
jgi:hypothetical protein